MRHAENTIWEYDIGLALASQMEDWGEQWMEKREEKGMQCEFVTCFGIRGARGCVGFEPIVIKNGDYNTHLLTLISVIYCFYCLTIRHRTALGKRTRPVT